MRALAFVLLVLLASCGQSPLATSTASDDGGEALVREAAAGLVGAPAPALRFQTIEGRQIDLAALAGRRPVYIKFWATWCVPCLEQAPHLESVERRFGRELTVIAVDVGLNETRQNIERYRREHGLTMPIVMDDGALAAAFHLKATPQHVVLGRDGRITYVGHLANASLDAAIANAIAQPALLAGGPARAVSTSSALKVGAGLPDLRVSNVSGETIALTDPDHARPTAIVFLAPWCESYFAGSRPRYAANCRRARLQASALAAENGVRVVGIATGLWTTAADVEKYRRDHGVPYEVTLDDDGALFRRFGVNDVPSVVLVSAHGRIVGRVEADDAGLPALAHSLSAL